MNDTTNQKQERRSDAEVTALFNYRTKQAFEAGQSFEQFKTSFIRTLNEDEQGRWSDPKREYTFSTQIVLEQLQERFVELQAPSLLTQVQTLQSVNAELCEALEAVSELVPRGYGYSEAFKAARAALAKAKEQV